MDSQFKSSFDQRVAESGLEVYRDNAPPLAHGPYSHSPSEVVPNQIPNLGQRRNKRGFCDVPILWILAAIVSFIVGGAIGGGIGAGVRLNEKSSSSSSPNQTQSISTVTLTSTAASAPTTVAHTINDEGCPYSVNNGSIYTSLTSTNYTILCNTDITPGTDIPAGEILGTSIYSCLDACTRYNENATSVAADGTCVGATWAIYNPGNLAVAGHCFLKTGKTLTEVSTGAIGLCGLVQG